MCWRARLSRSWRIALPQLAREPRRGVNLDKRCLYWGSCQTRGRSCDWDPDRWDKSTARRADTTRVFREIPAGSMFFGAGAYWWGPDSNRDVWGSGHANLRFLCGDHDKVRQRQEALAETLVHLLHVTPRLLPPDQFCGVCAGDCGLVSQIIHMRYTYGRESRKCIGKTR